MKITAEMRKQIRQELARAGGEARAKKYDSATLSKWAKKGGRPRKDGSGSIDPKPATAEKGKKK